MRVLILLVAVILMSNPASAKKPQDKKQKKQQQQSSQTVQSKAEVKVGTKGLSVNVTANLFSNNEVVVLQQYQSHGQKKLPKGLQKKVAKGGTLPPGWQKKLSPGMVIGQSTYGLARPLPKEVLVKLPTPPHGTIIVEIEGEIVRLAEASLTIIDILSHR